MDNLLADAIEQFLAAKCTPQQVRAIEAGASAQTLWSALHDAGYADALVAAQCGGAGLGLAEASAIALACGRHALPLPLTQTMLARAALAAAGIAAPPGPIALADAAPVPREEEMVAARIPCGRTAAWLLAKLADGDWLLPLAAAEMTPDPVHGSLAAAARWRSWPGAALRLPGTAVDWRALGAAASAAQMAGALQRLCAMTIGYANERSQFGKPIGKLQVIQQQISVMAEQTFAAQTATAMAWSGSAIAPLRAAAAKARCGEAAVAVAAISHSVHGAIGVTAEYDLQLYTRRLYEWRLQYGSESYWNFNLGEALLGQDDAPLAFVRQTLAAAIS